MPLVALAHPARLSRAKGKTKPKSRSHATPNDKNEDWDSNADKIVENFQSEMFTAALFTEKEQNKEIEDTCAGDRLLCFKALDAATVWPHRTIK